MKKRGRKKHRKPRRRTAAALRAAKVVAVGGLNIRTLADEGMLPPSTGPAPNRRGRASAAVLAHIDLVRSRVEGHAESAARNA